MSVYKLFYVVGWLGFFLVKVKDVSLPIVYLLNKWLHTQIPFAFFKNSEH